MHRLPRYWGEFEACLPSDVSESAPKHLTCTADHLGYTTQTQDLAQKLNVAKEQIVKLINAHVLRKLCIKLKMRSESMMLL